MANFIEEPSDEVQLNDNEELGSLDTDEIQEQVQEPVRQAPSDELPEKYKGKDIKDIIRMHQEAEKLLGRHSQEVGELRRTVDDFIKGQTAKGDDNSPSYESDVDDDAFYANPKEAVAKSIDSHPAIQQAKLAAEEFKLQKARAELMEKHPDFQEVVTSEGFQSWVQGSRVRQRLLVDADQRLDMDAADELLTLYKERQQTVSASAKANKEQNRKAIKEASTGVVNASSEPKSRKIYRRKDIIHMMQTDPNRYERLQDEIMKAYAEGRVR